MFRRNGASRVGRMARMWIPRDVAGCVLWLRGDLGVTLTSGKVSTWADQSGAGHDATQSTAGNRPTTNASGINGRPTVAFAAASSQWLGLPDLSALAAAEIHVVLKLTHDPTASTASAGLWRFDDDPNGSVIPWTDGNVYDAFGTTARKSAGSSAGAFASPAIYSVASKASAWTNWINGTQLFTTATNTFAMTATPRLGAYPAGPPTPVFLDGQIAEVAMFSRVLSATEHARVVRYFGERYAITVP